MPADALVVYQGAQLDVVFDVTDEADVPIPLTGYAAAMQVRPQPGHETLLLDLSTADGTLVIEPGGAVGEIHAHAGANLTVAMTRGGFYDCLAWPTSDPTAVLLIASGAVVVRPRVTQKP